MFSLIFCYKLQYVNEESKNGTSEGNTPKANISRDRDEDERNSKWNQNQFGFLTVKDVWEDMDVQFGIRWMQWVRCYLVGLVTG